MELDSSNEFQPHPIEPHLYLIYGLYMEVIQDAWIAVMNFCVCVCGFVCVYGGVISLFHVCTVEPVHSGDCLS